MSRIYYDYNFIKCWFCVFVLIYVNKHVQILIVDGAWSLSWGKFTLSYFHCWIIYNKSVNLFMTLHLDAWIRAIKGLELFSVVRQNLWQADMQHGKIEEGRNRFADSRILCLGPVIFFTVFLFSTECSSAQVEMFFQDLKSSVLNVFTHALTTQKISMLASQVFNTICL